MAQFRCSGCLQNKHLPKSVYPDSPIVKGYCDTESPGRNPTPGGCLYPQYLSAAKRARRVHWERI